MQAAGFKGPQVPLPHGWGAGEGRYKTYYTLFRRNGGAKNGHIRRGCKKGKRRS